AQPMFVVKASTGQLVQIGIEVVAEHALVVCAGDDMPKMPDDIIRKERLAIVVPIQSPGIRRAVGDHFEEMPCRMITPNAATEPSALALRSAGPADQRGRSDAMAAIEPPVR